MAVLTPGQPPLLQFPALFGAPSAPTLPQPAIQAPGSPVADPNQQGLQGIIWRALGMNTPDFITNLNPAIKGYASGSDTPAVPAAPPSQPQMGTAPAIAGVPRVSQT